MSKIRCLNCDSGIHNHCDGCNLYNISKDSALKEIIDYLEELKALRVELERNSKELEVYKKALEMACDGMGFNYCKSCQLEHRYVNCSDCNTKEDGWVEHYLQKARGEV